MMRETLFQVFLDMVLVKPRYAAPLENLEGWMFSRSGPMWKTKKTVGKFEDDGSTISVCKCLLRQWQG